MSNSDTAASNAAAAGIKSPRYRNNSATTNVAVVAKARRGCATNRCRIASGKPAALRSSRKMATNRLTGARKGFNRIPPHGKIFCAVCRSLVSACAPIRTGRWESRARPWTSSDQPTRKRTMSVGQDELSPRVAVSVTRPRSSNLNADSLKGGARGSTADGYGSSAIQP